MGKLVVQRRGFFDPRGDLSRWIKVTPRGADIINLTRQNAGEQSG